MQLSVIVLNYNVRYHLELCLLSVTRAIQHMKAEIIVVDNASSDGSLQMLAECFPNLKVIANAKNLGFSKANNLGVKAASGTYVCILNPDTVVPENCFEHLLAFAETKKKLGAIGIRLVDGTGTFLPESKRNLPTPKVALAKLLKNSRAYYASDFCEENTGKVQVLVGAFMFLKREVYNQQSGFDEDYFMYGEDIDLSYRLLQAGYDNYYCGDVPAIHFKGESTLRDKTYATRFYEAMGIFYAKHFGANDMEARLVSLALRAAKGVKTFSKTRNAEEDFNSPALIISSDKTFINQMQTAIPVKAEVCDILPATAHTLYGTLIILDAGSFSFKEIIDCMQTLNKGKNTFRIRPPDCNFILGSDSSTRQGDVTLLRSL
ncbi:MAG TPA: glycosyltransferase family 2 protein [Leeuwenhoekiella sp.]|nr:glycosyltransferase family 2 protein [Leeuwenhoekiella sp.]